MSAVATDFRLSLPPPLLEAKPSAHVEYGRRAICWSLTEPGSWHLCRYNMAWLDVSEREPWAGEPLHLSATRRLHYESPRDSFTDKSRTLIAAELLPLVARYGFSRLWVELHRTKTTEHHVSRAEQARAEAQWWQQRSDLNEMHMLGVVDFRPVRPDDGRREVTVKVVPEHGSMSYEPVMAAALVDGDQVGWMTRGGQLIPMATVLG